MANHSHDDKARLRRFAVTVDGVRHEVIVEELDATESSSDVAASPAPPTAERTSGIAPGDNGDHGGNALGADGLIRAPMPGTVTEIAVHVGGRVEAGDTLLILTAMKLENEITAPISGIVDTLSVREGDNVNSDDELLRLRGGEASS